MSKTDDHDEWCGDYHCAGDCGLRGHGYQHANHEEDPEQQEWVISGLCDPNEEPNEGNDRQDTSPAPS